MSGEATIITDRDIVKKHYIPALKGWVGDLGDGKHDGGVEDPRIGIIKVVAKTATYAAQSGTVVGRSLEIAKGAITGEVPKVTKLRELTEAELTECESLRAFCPFSHPVSLLYPLFLFFVVFVEHRSADMAH